MASFINPTLLAFIRKEMIQAVRDPRMKVILFIMPFVQMTVFGLAISNEVKNMRLAVLCAPDDYVLRDVYDRALAGGWFIPAEGEGEDAVALIRSRKADAVLVAPPGGFVTALGRGEAPLQLLTDATNAVQAQSVENYLRAIIGDVLKDDLKIEPPESPVRFDVRVLFNPSLETSIFMVPGVMVMVMVISTMVLTNLAIVREKEQGTFEMLISAPVSKSEIIYGKTIPYVVIGLTQLPLILAVAVFIFHVPMRGSFAVLLLAAFAFVCTTVSLGTLISTFCANQQQASLGGFWYMFPAIMFSGLIFPIQNMPASVQWVAYIDPLAHFLGLLRNIMLKGGDTSYIIVHVAALFALAVVSVAASFKRFHTTLS